MLTIVKQDASAAAVGGVYSLIFLLSGTLMMVGAAVVTALGLGPFLTVMAALHLACTLAAFVHIIRSCSDCQMPQHMASRQASTAFLQSAMRVVSMSLKDPQAAPMPAAASAAQSGSPAQAGECRTAGRKGGRGAGSGPMQVAAGQAAEGCGCQAAQLDSCEAGGGGKLAA